jgi:hypothetical protein
VVGDESISGRKREEAVGFFDRHAKRSYMLLFTSTGKVIMCWAMADMVSAILYQVGAGNCVPIPWPDEHQVLSKKRFHSAIAVRDRFV